MRTINGRVVDIIRLGTSYLGNPSYRVVIDTSTDEPGIDGALRTTERYAPNATHCYTCSRTWTTPTPSARCPWEHVHDERETVRTSPDSGLAYGIGNPEYRDEYHTFTLYANGAIKTVTPA